MPKILVVEDDIGVQLVMRWALTKAKYEVVMASNAEEALLALTSDIAVAIVDYRLPGLPGDILCAWMRDRRPDLRLILTSGSRPGLPCPDVAFLPKPFSPRQLVEAIQ